MSTLTALQKEINSIVVTAKSLVVTTAEHLQVASNFLVACAKRKELVHKEFDENIAKANILHKSLTAQRKKHLDPVLSAEAAIKQKISGYQIEQDRKVQEAQTAAAKEARVKAEQEKEAEAKQVEAEGFPEEAKTIRKEERVLTIETPQVAQTAKPAGLSYVDTWKYDVLDLEALIKARPDLVIADEKAIGANVRSLKAKFKVPGIKVWCEKTPRQKKV